MTRRADLLKRPRDYVIDGNWPTGATSPDEPAAAYVAFVARALDAALQDVTKLQMAKRAGVARRTLYNLLDGTHWPDLVTLVRLEQACGLRLWPAEPLIV